MMKTSRIALVLVLAAMVATVAPVSAALYQGGLTESDRVTKFVTIADRAGDRVQSLVDLVSANTTAIENASLIDEFNANVTLLETGFSYLDNASISLAAEDYDGAVGNATEALTIFRQVLTSIHYILHESGIAIGDIVEAQGLLTAMDRTLERIERLREILDNVDPEDFSEESLETVLAKLDEAETYLNKDAAIQLILDGNATEVAYNLTQANTLISEVQQFLKSLVKGSALRRTVNYLELMARTRERVRERFMYMHGEGVDVNGVLNQLGYANMTEYMQTLQNMTQEAREAGSFGEALLQLQEIGQTIREMDQALTQAMNQHMAQYGQGGAGGEAGNGQEGGLSGNYNGSGNGQGSGGNS